MLFPSFAVNWPLLTRLVISKLIKGTNFNFHMANNLLIFPLIVQCARGREKSPFPCRLLITACPVIERERGGYF